MNIPDWAALVGILPLGWAATIEYRMGKLDKIEEQVTLLVEHLIGDNINKEGREVQRRLDRLEQNSNHSSPPRPR